MQVRCTGNIDEACWSWQPDPRMSLLTSASHRTLSFALAMLTFA